jgi:hypothetical protein
MIGNSYSEVEANPQDLEKEEETNWSPFGGDKEHEPEDDDGGSSIWNWFDDSDSDEGPAEDEPSKDDENDEETNDTVITENEGYEDGGGDSMVFSPSNAAGSGGFTSGGRTGIVPFHSVTQCNYTRMYHPGSVPTAFVDGGRTGSTAWAGGGGAGPKGNEKSGSYTAVPPVYAARGNWFSNADAWVESGGTVDVKRSYVTSNPGDQGNGWWVSPLAAARLERHEQMHVATAQSDYASSIDPMLRQVGTSATLGKGKMFWKSDAIALLKKTIGWESALKKFEEQDSNNNGQGGWVDQMDIYGGSWPATVGPREIEGKVYDKVLVMGSESDPGKPVTPANP